MICAYVAPGLLEAAVAYWWAELGRSPRVSKTFAVREWTVAAGRAPHQAQNGASSPAEAASAVSASWMSARGVAGLAGLGEHVGPGTSGLQQGLVSARRVW
ncbi:hypothetical protein [Streptomyces bacillaris]|uniref:hypothetical protein n=1 Tax=Streptomyces bacillaris TaxID=68179 RepID=UPI003645458A